MRFLLLSVLRGVEIVVLAAACSSGGALAAVTVSSNATQNMSCSNGVCTPTATKAVLNAGDLETLLASRNVVVTTTGQGVQAKDIEVKAAVVWSSGSALTLEAFRSVTVDEPISITGQSGLVVQTGGNGTFSFGGSGNVTFANLSSALMINASAYTLVGDIKTLASDILSNESGDFALANSYDASTDGTYQSSPIGIFSGTLEGLGNAISNLSVDGGTAINGSSYEGFFGEIEAGGIMRNFALPNANFLVPGTVGVGAALVAWSLGTVQSCAATGSVVGEKGKHVSPIVGGLVGLNDGAISNSHAAVNVTAKHNWAGGLVGINGEFGINYVSVGDSYATGEISGPDSGGLVGYNFNGTVMESYATGRVRVPAAGIGRGTEGGGLIGENHATVANSYATGAVTGGDSSTVGGMIGASDAPVSFSYSTGSVSGGAGSLVGGLIGDDGAPAGSLDDTFWDTDTSGITNLSQGAGNIPNDPGITGLTTAQFQSGLPAGFDPKIWAENPKINGGLPYLISNPPPKPE